MGGVFGRLSGSNIFITSSSLLVEGAREGAHKLSGSAARLGAVAAGKNGIGIEEVVLRLSPSLHYVTLPSLCFPLVPLVHLRAGPPTLPLHAPIHYYVPP